MATIYQIDAYMEADGSLTPFHLEIAEAQRTRGENDYFCRILAPSLFPGCRDIFGVDKDQARELAIDFVRQLLQSKRLVDKNGNPIRV